MAPIPPLMTPVPQATGPMVEAEVINHSSGDRAFGRSRSHQDGVQGVRAAGAAAVKPLELLESLTLLRSYWS